jgi:FG-GAP-like repeat
VLVAGDFDHDGFPDLAGHSGLEPSEILYFFGDGHGNFKMQAVVGPEGDWAAVGDFNGDGLPDVVIPDRFNFVSLALGRKDRNFVSPVALYPAIVTGISAETSTATDCQTFWLEVSSAIPGASPEPHFRIWETTRFNSLRTQTQLPSCLRI